MTCWWTGSATGRLGHALAVANGKEARSRGGDQEDDLEYHAGKVLVVVDDEAVSIPAVSVAVEVSGRDLAVEARRRTNRSGPDRWRG